MRSFDFQGSHPLHFGDGGGARASKKASACSTNRTFVYFVYHQSTQHILKVRDTLFFLQCLYSFVKEQNTVCIFPTLGSWLCHERWLFGESLWAQRCPGLFHNLRDGTTLEPYILTLAHWTEVAIRTAARKITDTVFVLGSSRILRRLVCFPLLKVVLQSNCNSIQSCFRI